MSWMSMLYQTYKNNAARAGNTEEEPGLSVVAHMTANAQLEITLDEEGNFMSVQELKKGEGKTLIPVTEQSAGRSSGAAPHALCDTLPYLAGDYARYTGAEENSKVTEKFEKYEKALERWVHSEYSHPKAEAVYKYIQKKNVISDLIQSGRASCDENGLLDNRKISGNAYDKVLVRFRVRILQDEFPTGVWQDKSLLQCYTSYYLSMQQGRRDICYLTGETETAAEQHPKGIVAANYGAKLISANDDTGFTFRGRFRTSDEACAVGYQSTQKVHSALTWLAAKQGVTIGTQDKRTYICWNPKGKKVPELFNPFGLPDDPEEFRSNAEANYKRWLQRIFDGYQEELQDQDDIVIIALDAATTGRLSITYYNELNAKNFISRLKEWGECCSWYVRRYDSAGKPGYVVQTPLVKVIPAFAFGSEQGNFVEVSDKVMKEQSQRILHCMIDGERVPRDVVHALALKASALRNYSIIKNREQLLAITCAMLKKYYKERGVEYEMELEMEKDRSYQFGRLLAVLEQVERSAYDKGEERETNAMRLQTAFVNHPMRTWNTLEQALNPYYQKLPVKLREWYKNMIGEITESFKKSSYAVLNRRLEDSYLLGYYLQRKELHTSKKEREEKAQQNED